jgi:hypothetical protein
MRLLCAIVVTGTWASTPGCVGMEDVRAARDKAAALAEHLDSEADRWEAVAAGLEPGSGRRADAEAIAGVARGQAAALEAGVRRVDLALGGENNPLGVAGLVLEAVLPWAPEPVRLPLVLGAALVGSLVRSASLKKGIVSMVKGLDTAMRDDDRFASAFGEHANTFRSTQTALAKRVVDRVAGRAVSARMGA